MPRLTAPPQLINPKYTGIFSSPLFVCAVLFVFIVDYSRDFDKHDCCHSFAHHFDAVNLCHTEFLHKQTRARTFCTARRVIGGSASAMARAERVMWGKMKIPFRKYDELMPESECVVKTKRAYYGLK